MKDATAPITIKVIGGTPTTEFPWWLLAVAVVGSIGVYAVVKKPKQAKKRVRR